MSDKTRDIEESKMLVQQVVLHMVDLLGYTEAEAWERVADELSYQLETHAFDFPSLEHEMQLASMVSQVQVIDVTSKSIDENLTSEDNSKE